MGEEKIKAWIEVLLFDPDIDLESCWDEGNYMEDRVKF